MIDRIDFQKLMSSFQADLEQTKDIKKTIENILKQNVSGIEDSIDMDTLANELMKLNEPLSSIQDINEDCNTLEILETTLNQFKHNFEDATIEIFKELIIYDKLIVIDDTTVFAKIYNIIKILYAHKDSIDKLNELEDKNIAKTNLKINEVIQPRINTFKDAVKYNEVPVNTLSKNIYEEFDKSPRQINAMFELIDISKLEDVDRSLIDTLNNQHQFLNSSETLKDTHIFTSAQIYCFASYKSENNKDVKKQLSKETLSEYTNQILNDFFEYDYNSNLNRNHILKKVQHKTYFNQIPILEFQTPKNIKEHPVFY